MVKLRISFVECYTTLKTGIFRQAKRIIQTDFWFHSVKDGERHLLHGGYVYGRYTLSSHQLLFDSNSFIHLSIRLSSSEVSQHHC